MKRSSWITGILLAAVVVVIIAALLAQAASGPTFRAEDHATYEECMAAIPGAWPPGSLERTGAEDACRYVHRQPAGRVPE
jgi:hypothetical protein